MEGTPIRCERQKPGSTKFTYPRPTPIPVPIILAPTVPNYTRHYPSHSHTQHLFIPSTYYLHPLPTSTTYAHYLHPQPISIHTN